MKLERGTETGKEPGRETEKWADSSREGKDLQRLGGINYVTVLSGNFRP